MHVVLDFCSHWLIMIDQHYYLHSETLTTIHYNKSMQWLTMLFI